MLAALKNLIGALSDSETQPRFAPDDFRVAAAALLIHVATIDGAFFGTSAAHILLVDLPLLGGITVPNHFSGVMEEGGEVLRSYTFAHSVVPGARYVPRVFGFEVLTDAAEARAGGLPVASCVSRQMLRWRDFVRMRAELKRQPQQ